MASKACATCKKTADEIPDMKRCAKCHSTSYCSRECQKVDWKSHKKICSKQAAGNASNGPKIEYNDDYQTPTVTNLEKQIPDPFTRLDNKTYLHDRPEKDVFKLLIDTFRMRQEDDYKFEGEVDEDSVYTGAPSSLEGFCDFLDLVSQRPGLFPPWWNDSKQTECEQFGETGGNWSSLREAVEKTDVIEHYSDPRMPMQLRMLAEDVYGSPPAGSASGREMRKIMMAMEAHEGRDGEDVWGIMKG